MFIPAPRLLWFLVALLLAAIVVSIFAAFAFAWAAVAVVLAAIAAFDALAARRIRPPLARRLLPGSLPLGVAHDVVLRLANAGEAQIVCAVHDHYSGGAEVRGMPQRLTVAAGGWAEVRYRVRPVRRGELAFGRVEALLDSPFGLWQVRRWIGEGTSTRVYPNFAELAAFALLATDHRLSQIGVLQRRRRGEGLDFHQLREYREGDSQRQVDWKASARMHRLVSREYQDERDQQIVLLIDCGRRMAARDDELAHFDHVLNAALLLAYVSLRQGDAVGFLLMAGEPRWLAPRKSTATVNLILDRLYDVQPTLKTSDYYQAAIELMKRLRKRALVVILTNLRDEDDDTLGPALRLLQSRHLVLFASLRETILTRALAAPIESFDDALTHAATAEYLHRRELGFRRLERAGAVCLDVEPGQLPIALVNRYIDIKRSGRL